MYTFLYTKKIFNCVLLQWRHLTAGPIYNDFAYRADIFTCQLIGRLPNFRCKSYNIFKERWVLSTVNSFDVWEC